MTLLARAVALLLALGAGAAAWAQDGRLSEVSSGLVAFTVGAEDLAAAEGCPGCTYVYPDAEVEIAFTVVRQNPNRLYTIDALHDGWQPAGGPQLEARYTVTTRDGARELVRTAWLALSEAPELVFTQAAVQRETQVLVRVEYRLALRGDEAAGTFAAQVTHRVRETGSALSHDVLATLPTYLHLRLVGEAGAIGAASVAFDYGRDPLAYVRAVTGGTPLPPTAVDLVRAEVSTNRAGPFTVTLVVEALLEPVGAEARARLLLQGALADGRVFAGNGPTDGFVTLFAGDDYALRVDGGETPGATTLSVRLQAIADP